MARYTLKFFLLVSAIFVTNAMPLGGRPSFCETLNLYTKGNNSLALLHIGDEPDKFKDESLENAGFISCSTIKIPSPPQKVAEEDFLQYLLCQEITLLGTQKCQKHPQLVLADPRKQDDASACVTYEKALQSVPDSEFINLMLTDKVVPSVVMKRIKTPDPYEGCEGLCTEALDPVCRLAVGLYTSSSGDPVIEAEPSLQPNKKVSNKTPALQAANNIAEQKTNEKPAQPEVTESPKPSIDMPNANAPLPQETATKDTNTKPNDPGNTEHSDKKLTNDGVNSKATDTKDELIDSSSKQSEKVTGKESSSKKPGLTQTTGNKETGQPANVGPDQSQGKDAVQQNSPSGPQTENSSAGSKKKDEASTKIDVDQKTGNSQPDNKEAGTKDVGDQNADNPQAEKKDPTVVEESAKQSDENPGKPTDKTPKKETEKSPDSDKPTGTSLQKPTDKSPDDQNEKDPETPDQQADVEGEPLPPKEPQNEEPNSQDAGKEGDPILPDKDTKNQDSKPADGEDGPSPQDTNRDALIPEDEDNLQESFIDGSESKPDSIDKLEAEGPEKKQDANEVPPPSNVFPEQEDSHFFAYFLTVIIIIILAYLVIHNKQKILGLIVEGRGNQRRRSHSYRKLDTESSKGSQMIF